MSKGVMRSGFVALVLWVMSVVPAIGQGATCVNGAATATTWNRWECRFEVQGSFAGRAGYASTKLRVNLGPQGQLQEFSTYAFWDGGTGSAADKARFVFRFAFPKIGASSPTTWTWSTTCETPATCGGTTPSLITSGSVSVTNYVGASPLYNRGFLTAIQIGWEEGGIDRWWSTLRYPPNTPAVWVGDSAWAAPLKATDADWQTYVLDRKVNAANPNAKGATVIHIGLAPAWVGASDAEGNAPFTTVSGCTPTDPIAPTNCSLPVPAFWRNLEDKIQVANSNELHVFVAGLMEPRSDHPGSVGPEDFPAAAEARTFARWMASRLAGNHVILSPGFDAPLITKNGQQLQRYVGQEIDLVVPSHPLTNHWGTVSTGQMDDLQTDSWLDFQMFQSGQNRQDPDNVPTQLNLLTERARTLAGKMSGTNSSPPAIFVNNRKPAVNGEAIYDQLNVPNANYTSYRARQAAYLSWLSGAFGATFGIGGIWDWGVCGVPTPNPCSYRMPVNYRSFSQALNRGSSLELKHMANLIRAYQANNLEYLDTYEQSRILNNAPDEYRKMVVARGSDYLLAYLPHNDKIRLNTSGLSLNPDAGYLFNPFNGTTETVRENATTPRYSCDSSGGWCEWENRFYLENTPASSDRVFYVAASSGAGLWSRASGPRIEAMSGALPRGDGSAGPWGILGRISSPRDGTSGELFYVTAEEGVIAVEPAAASDGAGRFFVAWQADADGDGWQEILGRWVDASDAHLGYVLRISPVEGRDHIDPSVGVSAQGEAVVTWSTGDSIPGALSEVWGQTIGPSGELASAAVGLGIGGGYDHSRARVASDPSGGVTLAWLRRDGPAYTVVARRFSGLLTPLSDEVELQSGNGAGPWLEPIEIDSRGHSTVRWEARDTYRGRGKYLQRLDENGWRLGQLESQ